ncbi:hypothetical protein WR25_15021 isoform E [Diploscapter pachys]|uniref:Phosphate transporter n=1 Tax=Diploscapter pachys TaxID=2018661 RepID=A0A2A2JA77_9BILA|nr:hypothetical protein WR25_15021 isoform B [Diploscapter pachys]PAV58573.1 hypothetical protein WR25_15021 isoform D [Diploscapter pachys]PAV58574.1 hypothetical protein WR25_15021 isoform E [Diploscapter pachys]
MDTTTLLTTIATSIDFDRSAVLWALIVGVILAFLLGAGMGANDVSNAFGTSVGSKVVTVIQAYILATIFETLGAVLVGWSVTDTMRKGIVDTSLYSNDAMELLVGQVAILGGCAAWLMLATAFHMPVSTTHSLMGATLGFSLTRKGFQGVQWKMLGKIVASWFVSPLLSGTISAVLYCLVDHLVLRREHPLESGLHLLPIFYFACITFITFAVTYDGSKLLYLDRLAVWQSILIALGFGIVTALIIQFIVKPRLRARIANSSSNHNIKQMETVESETEKKIDVESQTTKRSSGIKSFFNWLLPDRTRENCPETVRLFGTIQLFTACCAGFAHGANDVR